MAAIDISVYDIGHITGSVDCSSLKYFYIKTGEDTYIPVDLDWAKEKEEHYRQSSELFLYALNDSIDFDDSLRIFRRDTPSNKGNSKDKENAIILFFALGYQLSDDYLVICQYATHIDHFIDLYSKGDRRRNELKTHINYSCGAKSLEEKLKALEEEVEKKIRFGTKVIVPISEVLRIVIEEGIMIFLGGAVIRGLSFLLRGVLRVGRASRAYKYAKEIFKPMAELLKASSRNSGVRLLLGKIKRALLRVVGVIWEAKGKWDDAKTLAQILDQLTIAYNELNDISQFADEVGKNQGELSATWEGSMDKIEEEVFKDAIAYMNEIGIGEIPNE